MIGADTSQMGFGSGDLSLRGLRLQLEIARIEFSDHITPMNGIAGIDETLRQFTADPEGQDAFFPRPDVPGESGRSTGFRRFYRRRSFDKNRPRRLRRSCLVAASAQCRHH